MIGKVLSLFFLTIQYYCQEQYFDICVSVCNSKGMSQLAIIKKAWQCKEE